MLSMLMDHAGLLLFPQLEFLRVAGRLAFPIFAYMIAEGCRYTKHRGKYLSLISVMAVGIQAVYFFAQGSLYQNILVTFSLSVAVIFAIDSFIAHKSLATCAVMLISLSGVIFLSLVAPFLWEDQGFVIDYGFWGILLPVAVYYIPGKWKRLAATAVILLLRGILYGELKWFALLALPLLAAYNGQRGKAKLKYLFYIFYPAHLVLLYIIELWWGI